ncbi:hypothetical protein HanXRQr2_Chr11g0513181 [Helianthus annuus]|uniref:Uncharacterized protein n=1 Tax=Helianthus annuus TaxID=4232 RepID=A0A251TD98_HELAN|nr:hypothetical protein HanXRQr2_Chr11g0513181 [Helianthus annuus]KAJ0876942.1 hypothetical protein HanPSC8_Chr11g0494461 [Helianthus annuus]
MIRRNSKNSLSLSHTPKKQLATVTVPLIVVLVVKLRTWLTTVSSRTLFFEYLPSNPRTLGTLWSLHKEEQVVVGKGS